MDRASGTLKAQNSPPASESTSDKRCSTSPARPKTLTTKAVVREGQATSDRPELRDSSPQGQAAGSQDPQGHGARGRSTPTGDTHRSFPVRTHPVHILSSETDLAVTGSEQYSDTASVPHPASATSSKLSSRDHTRSAPTDVSVVASTEGASSPGVPKKPARPSVRFASDEKTSAHPETDERRRHDHLSPDAHLSVMTLKEFESLPPMWEEGGRFGLRWGKSCEESVDRTRYDGGTIFLSDVEGEETDDCDDVFSERETTIEQNLREIYVSPFHAHIQQQEQQQQQQQQQQRPQVSTPQSALSKRYRVDSAGNSLPAANLGRAISLDDGVILHDADVKESDDDPGGEVCGQQVTPLLTSLRRSKSVLEMAAERAVSGYRSCHDADDYVGTRKPTLILARAPPTPFGILRRNNRRDVKGVSVGVRWADNSKQAESLPPDNVQT